MKRSALTIFLITIVIILSFILLLFIDTSPKRIKNEENGTMFHIGDISFNLSSTNYIENETLKNSLIERGENPNNTKGWIDKDGANSFVILYFPEDRLFDDQLKLLKNPFYHLKFEKKIPKEDDSRIYKVKTDYYVGYNKIGILNKYFKKDSIDVYSFELKIGNGYYVVVAQQNDENNQALDNIMEFMRTASINK